MNDKGISEAKPLSKHHLHTINGIKFSPREIDIIAFIVGGRSTKKIAILSGLSPRTVENYTRNIMTKLECNSRESIIDFIEKSDKLFLIRNHYSALINHESISEPTHLDPDTHPNNDCQTDCQTPPSPLQLWKRKWVFLSGVTLILVCGGIYLLLYKKNLGETRVYLNERRKSSSVRSDLITPSSSNLLPRSDILNQIEKSFKDQEGIQTLALVGIGGAGKTTIARHYASQQNLPVVWEINAETHENLQDSFGTLAQALSQTGDDKKLFEGLKKIKDPKEKEKKVIQFVKSKLRNHPGWLLVFDNVEKISDIQNYFPHDSKVWGSGKIILTTTDSNIQTNPYINNTIFINFLSPEESLSLFKNIMMHGDKTEFSNSQREEAKKFLEKIPAFPLDISVAAYHLKATHVDYNQYLNNINIHNAKFFSFQEKILKEVSDYTKTRYSIITLSAQQLIHENPEFVGLLLLVCLLDSQNIPRDLLDIYKNNIIVDDFIYNLKKYSLITGNPNHLFQFSSSFSIHRNIQGICLTHLTKTFAINKDHPLMQSIGSSLERYTNQALEREDFDHIKLTTHHLHKFLSNESLLTAKLKATLGIELGRSYFYLGRFIDAKKWLERAVLLLNKCVRKDNLTFLRAQSYRGVVNRELGNYEQARDLLEDTLANYQQHYSKHYMEIAWNSAHLANVYRSLGGYEKAKALLEQSLDIYKSHLPNNHLDLAWVSARLAYVYKSLGQYEQAKTLFENALTLYQGNLSKDHIKVACVLVHLANVYSNMEEYEKAKPLLEKSLSIYKRHFPKDHVDIAWASVHFAKVCRKLGEHKKAQSLLEESFSIYQSLFKDDHPKTAWMLRHLGVHYTDLGQYDKARNFLERSLAIYEKKYDVSHQRTAKILYNLGETYLLNNDLETAANFFHKAFSIYSKHEHSDRYKTLEGLGEVFMKKSNLSADKGDMKQAQKYNEQALVYLKQAQEIVSAHFSKGSSQWKRLEKKVTEVKL